eukprot:g10748.t1
MLELKKEDSVRDSFVREVLVCASDTEAMVCASDTEAVELKEQQDHAWSKSAQDVVRYVRAEGEAQKRKLSEGGTIENNYAPEEGHQGKQAPGVVDENNKEKKRHRHPGIRKTKLNTTTLNSWDDVPGALPVPMETFPDHAKGNSESFYCAFFPAITNPDPRAQKIVLICCPGNGLGPGPLGSFGPDKLFLRLSHEMTTLSKYCQKHKHCEISVLDVVYHKRACVDAGVN